MNSIDCSDTTRQKEEHFCHYAEFDTSHQFTRRKADTGFTARGYKSSERTKTRTHKIHCKPSSKSRGGQGALRPRAVVRTYQPWLKSEDARLLRICTRRRWVLDWFCYIFRSSWVGTPGAVGTYWIGDNEFL